MVNPNALRPIEENGAHGPRSRFAAKVAIAAAMFGAGYASMETTAAATPDKQPAPIISTSLNKLNHVEVDDYLRTLNGDSTYLIANPGATVYQKTKSGIRKEKLREEVEIIHGLFASRDGKSIASYKIGKKTYSLPLTGANTKHIEKSVYDDYYTGHREPFQPSDISYSTSRVSMVHNGVPYEASRSSEASAQHINGRWVIPLARGIESDEPKLTARESTTSSSPVVRGLKELNHVKQGDEVDVLSGRTSSLFARKGTLTYGFSGGKLVKSRLPQGHQIVHASYKNEAGRDMAYFRYAGRSYAIQLDAAANRGKIYENFYVDNDYRNEDAFRIKQFRPEDISTRTVRIDSVTGGELFSRSGLKSDPYTAEVGETGREMVRVAQSTTSPD